MNPFQQLKKNFYTRVNSPYVPCIPGYNNRTALVDGKEAPIVVYNGPSREKPSLLEDYIKKGYRFSEQRKREIHEKLYTRAPLRGLINMMVEKSKLELFVNQ